MLLSDCDHSCVALPSSPFSTPESRLFPLDLSVASAECPPTPSPLSQSVRLWLCRRLRTVHNSSLPSTLHLYQPMSLISLCMHTSLSLSLALIRVRVQSQSLTVSPCWFCPLLSQVVFRFRSTCFTTPFVRYAHCACCRLS